MDQNQPNKPPTTPVSSSRLVSTSGTTIANKNKATIPQRGGLHARLQNPVIAVDTDPNTRPNRIALLLDVSGSMNGERIRCLRDAVTSFIQACDFSDTALALEPFGEGNPPPNRMALMCFGPLLMTTVQMLQATDSTPMAEAMCYALTSYSLTRCVLVSDGLPDSESHAYAAAAEYREAGLPCDCVHIGESTSGEACLHRIAELTGGQYIKFTDINSFARSFKYLTPAYYAQLTSGGVSAAQLGATELK
jgi:Mg-chelatase subunit ChlD